MPLHRPYQPPYLRPRTAVKGFDKNGRDLPTKKIRKNNPKKAQNKAREIRALQDATLPKLQQQFSDIKGIVKGKERKTLEAKIQQVE